MFSIKEIFFIGFISSSPNAVKNTAYGCRKSLLAEGHFQSIKGYLSLINDYFNYRQSHDKRRRGREDVDREKRQTNKKKEKAPPIWARPAVKVDFW